VQAKLDGMVEDAVAEAVAGIGLSAEDEARIRREEQERHVRQIRECVREASGRRSSGTRAERFLDRLLEIPTEEEQAEEVERRRRGLPRAERAALAIRETAVEQRTTADEAAWREHMRRRGLSEATCAWLGEPR
jgi:hypothetical protein